MNDSSTRSGAGSRRGVLFVCTGNICRSPTAEGVFRTLVQRAGLDSAIFADSAGTHDYHVGDPPDPRAVAHASRRGYDLSDLRARKVGARDFARFDLLLACDEGHLRILRRLAPPEARGRVERLLDYAPDLGLREVPDPYYGDPAGFEHVLDIVERAAAGVLAALQRDMT